MKVWPNDQMIKYDRFKDRTPLGMHNLRKRKKKVQLGTYLKPIINT